MDDEEIIIPMRKQSDAVRREQRRGVWEKEIFKKMLANPDWHPPSHGKKLTWTQAREIEVEYRENRWPSLQEMADHYGVSTINITRIAHGMIHNTTSEPEPSLVERMEAYEIRYGEPYPLDQLILFYRL